VRELTESIAEIQHRVRVSMPGADAALAQMAQTTTSIVAPNYLYRGFRLPRAWLSH